VEVEKNTKTVMVGIYKKNKWTLAIILLAFVLEGCASFKEVSFERLYPPKVGIPEYVTRIGVINNADSTEPTQEVVESTAIPNVIGIVKNTLWTDLVTEGIAQNMADANNFEVITLDSIWKEKAKKFSTRKEFDDLIQLLGVDFILALNETKMTDTYSIQLLEDGSYRALIRGDLQNKIYLYFPDSQNPKQLNIQDTLYWDGYGATNEDAMNMLPSSNKILEDASFFAGESIAKYLVPHWGKVTRSLFYDDSPKMVDASIYAKKNQWEQARRIWQTLYESRSTGDSSNLIFNSENLLAAKAAYNMAVSYELFGDLVTANTWIDHAIDAAGGEKTDEANWFVEYKGMLK